MPEIKMPQLGESVVEGTITKWLKSEGDTVEEDELIVEISTDKVDSEVPSTASGKLTEILVPEGETVEVGQAIAVVGDEAGASSDSGEAAEQEAGDEQAAEAEQKAGDEQAAEAEQEEAGDEQAAEAEQEEAGDEQAAQAEQEEAGDEQAARAEEAAEAGQSEDREDAAAKAGEGDEAREAEAEAKEKAEETKGEGQKQAAAEGGGDTSKRGIISPLVRRLADEHGVDLSEVHGSGTGGRIRKQDVLRHVEQRKARPAAKPAASAEAAPEEERAPERREPAAVAPGERDEFVPWTNIRRRTAEHMAASAREVARAWNVVEADWTEVVKVREAAKGRFREREGFNLTYMAFLGKAVCETLLEMPMVNSTFDEANEGSVHHHYVNLGIAVALEGGGLIVPVVKGADEKNVVGLARAINEIVQKARSKKLSPDDLAGGTFTITNPGPFGSVISVPIIPRGQTAILAFESIRKEVRVNDDDSLAVRSVGYLPMSWDHRAIDGAEAAQFLSKLKEKIETIDFSQELGQYL
jgi:2-oxoglutarate dehydrogenase E2 component (dihydrolipoamide succinyltransferase)